MAGSGLHRSMKAIVRKELEEERYDVVEEPLYPPGPRVYWSRYRPDLIGYRRSNEKEEIVLVECETRPNMRRFWSKNHSSVSFQSYLFRNSSIRRILAVPQGKLRGVNLEMRNEWEVWILGVTRPMRKAGVLSTNPSPPGSEDGGS